MLNKLPPASEMEAYIRASAKMRGIDPDAAVRVARTEGLKDGVWQSNVRANGRREPSYGPFQLYTGGGLGNDFQKRTGLDPSDTANWKPGVDFALDHAKANGWNAWYGARDNGIPNNYGIDGVQASFTPPAPQTAATDPGPVATADVTPSQAPSQQTGMMDDFRAALGFPQVNADAKKSPGEVMAAALMSGQNAYQQPQQQMQTSFIVPGAQPGTLNPTAQSEEAKRALLMQLMQS